MPDCRGTSEADLANFLRSFITLWRRSGISAYMGVCGCPGSLRYNFLMFSPNPVDVCTQCGMPVQLTRIEQYAVRQLGEDWLIQPIENGGSDGQRRTTG